MRERETGQSEETSPTRAKVVARIVVQHFSSGRHGSITGVLLTWIIRAVGQVAVPWERKRA